MFYVVMSIVILLFLLLMWSTWQDAFPGLIGILFVVEQQAAAAP